jgi:hypothetical protein
VTKPTKPIVHARDHEHGGADPVRIVWESTGTGGGGGFPTFALTGGTFSFDTDDAPVILDAAALGSAPHFSTTDSATFDMSSGGRACILAPGMYVIGCQIDTKPSVDLTAQVDAYLQLQYGGSVGFSIEIPWAVSSLLNGSERLLGTRFDFPDTTTVSEDADVSLQRLHPISLTDFTTFPLEIQPTFATNSPDNFAWVVSWLGLWGFRLGDPLDSYHSD